MGPVSRAEERKLYNGLKKIFQGLMDDFKAGKIGQKDLDSKAKEYLKSPEVDKYLNSVISRMTRNVRSTTARDWREAAAKGSNSQLLYRLMKKEMDGPVGAKVWEIIANNVAYIKTLPQEWASYVTKYAAREALKGKRPEEIEAELRKVIPAHMAKNLKTIARTECAKAQAAIVQARAEAVGIRCYVWRSVRDERSRPAHAAMNGILVFYDDPPSPEALFGGGQRIGKRGKPIKGPTSYGNYHAGNTFNCRCWQEVVVDSRFLPDSFTYYRYGALHQATKGAFLKKFGKIA